jgi:translation elongation factor EF-G
VKSVTPRGTAVVIVARAPLASMFDWVSRLRGLTGGRGTAMVKTDGYEPIRPSR